MESNTDDQIEGQRIVAIREMTPAELDREGWITQHGSSIPAIELESGILLYPSADPEGNGPGALFGIDADDTAFALFL
ncbi:hypothetical protein [Haloglomus halophilum]|uniref:hypothetical protein n=1 Tax=Haloglomus halophilum TaxID=2962672 RepID=UPI0020CA1700|nr:hypothetical protein [Haloglomus halophilum]